MRRDAAQGGEHGIDDVAFEVRTNPGTRPGPLMKVASGGELARFLLALKVALADRGSAPTLVFDEIDTAVGGAVADAIGVRLGAPRRAGAGALRHPCARRSRRAPAAISSSPRKRRAAARTVVTRVTPLDDGRRREEIARMLAGATITDEARAAAERLILGAA